MMAMGIALLRIADPKMQSKAMDDYALAYLPCAPVEILLITFVPILFAAAGPTANSNSSGAATSSASCAPSNRQGNNRRVRMTLFLN